jgi:hypothetical protein
MVISVGAVLPNQLARVTARHDLFQPDGLL